MSPRHPRSTPSLPGRTFRTSSLLLLISAPLLLALTVARSFGGTVAIASTEQLAASELAAYLTPLYPQTRFTLSAGLPPAGDAILLGSGPEVRSLLPGADLSKAESYAVASMERDGRRLGVIAGADPRGTLYGVYALLQKLGCGFHLSGDALPAPQTEPFGFAAWSLASAPLVADRLVFNWHNFLSGCSTWNLEDWNRWTTQSQKMGYNAVMVHAYGNNPMVSFTFNGKTKPVGYLSTTTKGRDWSTMHVNDVRRIFGGQVFAGPVFGADAAQVSDQERATAARALMQGAFAHARQRGMEVFFANDVDTGSANPQDLILTLPESARFATKTKAGGLSGVKGEGNTKFWLANPETPEGYQYYRAQVAALLKAYPQITCLVVWFRNGGTPWMDFTLEEMPANWQAEYQSQLATHPEAAKFWHSHHLFGIGKITRAVQRALQELGHDGVRLAAGTWNFAFLPGADLFLPEGVPLIGLDYGVLHDDSKLSTPEHRQNLAGVGAHRPLIPVIWAHHDDGNYIGRPYTPFSDFHTRLMEAKSSGFGIIHWTTRPLDLFFTSHIRQVWQHSQNETLSHTCDLVASSWTGPSQANALGDYLESWITQAPKFARETSDHFIDRPLTGIPEVLQGARDRLKRLQSIDPALLTPEQRTRRDYFEGLERFILAFFETHERFQNAQAALKQGDLAGARAAMALCQPEPVIEQFARFSSLGRITRGEQGLVVSLNLRWLPHIVRLRQQIGLEAVRYRFGPTSHDPLAQASGRFTFHFDAGHQLWQTLGTEETGAPSFLAPGCDAETGSSGIETSAPLTLQLAPILAGRNDSTSLPAGNYQLRLLLADPISNAPGERVFSVAATATGDPKVSHLRFEPLQTKYLRLACHGNSLNEWNSIEEISMTGLARDSAEPVVTASREVKGFPASAAADGKRETRWAAMGRDEWIQLRLDPSAKLDRLAISWHAGETREARVELLASKDGQTWQPVRLLSRPAVTQTAEVDIFALAGGRNRVAEQCFDLQLEIPGRVSVTLTPRQGAALLCGAVLTPLDRTGR